MNHSLTTNNHRPYTFTYSNAAARLAATGFISTDVGKQARQTDDNTLWMLIDESPITWVQVSLPAGVWASWTPTWSKLTPGNGILVAKYTQIARVVIFHLSVVFGSTTSIDGTSVTFTLPVTRAAYGGTNGVTKIGDAALRDTSVGDTFLGEVDNLSTTTGNITYHNVSGTVLRTSSIGVAAPFTWGVGDEICIQGMYEAA